MLSHIFVASLAVVAFAFVTSRIDTEETRAFLTLVSFGLYTVAEGSVPFAGRAA